MAATKYGKAAAPGRGPGIRRDAALHRVSRVTKRIAVATVAAVGILGLYVSKSLPGHATTPSPAATTTPTTAAPSSGSSTGSSTTQTAPTAPANPPVTTRKPAHVTTGAS